MTDTEKRLDELEREHQRWSFTHEEYRAMIGELLSIARRLLKERDEARERVNTANLLFAEETTCAMRAEAEIQRLREGIESLIENMPPCGQGALRALLDAKGEGE